MVIITGALKLPPDRMDEARPYMRRLIAATRLEPGCILYAWAEDVVEPGLIRMIEHWRDWDSFVAHDNSAHANAWKAEVGRIGLLGREMSAHDGVNARSI
jgi:quinol monooxygenase YgiN